MKKFTSTIHDANLSAARVASICPTIMVRAMRYCGGCGGAATVLINGQFARCQPCANQVVNIWNEMRAAKDAALQGEDQ